ncbi:MAG: HD-GYP domain-containing protein [Acidiferrobacterales bacterium]|jgi:putative nucleotidyltransferase with HDIG domain|nr:HD-GYP domain-containing protein [Acidiferrobacterales bacterium]
MSQTDTDINDTESVYHKKVHAKDIQVGMYIYQLDRPWIETPFMFQGFEVQTDEQVQELQKHCQWVIIDTEKGADFDPSKGNLQDFQRRQKSLQDVDEEIRKKVQALANIKDAGEVKRKPYPDNVTFEDELVRAKEIEGEARVLMNKAIGDVAKGNNIDLEMATKAVGKMVDSIIRNPDAMVCLSQLKDVNEYTALHSVRTAIVALAFGRHLALSRDELNVVGMGALLHDVGMARLPKEILEKPGGLSVEEFQTMSNHVKWGIEILESSGGVPQGVIEMVEQHHERGDGSGYPTKRTAKAISPAGAIAGIVDVYDAITSDRHYSGGLSAEEALKRMYEWRKKDFKPQMVEEFIKCMGIFPIGSLVELSTGAIGVVITINRARRLKPKVALVLTASGTPFSHRFIADLSDERYTGAEELKIKRVLPSGAHGINPMDYIVQL